MRGRFNANQGFNVRENIGGMVLEEGKEVVHIARFLDLNLRY